MLLSGVWCSLLLLDVGIVLSAKAKYDFWELDALLRQAVKGHNCGRVVAEDSKQTTELIKTLHWLRHAPALMFGSRRPPGCNLNIYIAETISSLQFLLAAHPNVNSQFLIVLHNFNDTQFHNFLTKEGKRNTGNGKGALINLSQLDKIYKYSPINKSFKQKDLKDLINVVEGGREKYEDLEGQTLRVGTYNCSINSKIGPLDASGRPDWVGGVEMTFVHDLSKKLNFQYEIVVPRDGQGVGKVEEDGSIHGGLMQMVSGKQVELAFCGIIITNFMRMSSISLSNPINDICLTYLVPKPPLFTQMGLGLFNSFQWQVWAFSLAQTVFITLLLQFLAFLTVKASPVFSHLAVYKKLDKSLLLLWAILFNNAPKSLLSHGPLRHLFSWWALTALLLNTSFASSLISHLTQALYGSAVNSIEELVKEDFHWCTQNFPSFGSVFDLEDKWVQKWLERHCVADPEIQCEFIKDKEKKYAVFALSFGEGVMTLDNFPCPELLKGYQPMKTCLNKLNTGLALQSDSAISGIISEYISRYQESGIFHKKYMDEFHKMALKLPYAAKERGHKWALQRIQLKVSNVLATVYLYSLGVGLASSVFVVELVWFHRKTLMRFLCSRRKSAYFTRGLNWLHSQSPI